MCGFKAAGHAAIESFFVERVFGLLSTTTHIDTRAFVTLSLFKRRLKTFLFNQAFAI